MAQDPTQDAGSFVRAIEPTDFTTVKMLVGQGIMEGLALANKAFFWDPKVFTSWIITSLIVDYTFKFIPTPGLPLTYVTPLIGFALTALPLLGITEWIHRPIFTGLLRETMGSPDMVDMTKYYSSPSKVLVFTHRNEVHGVICLDAIKPGESLRSVLGAEDKILGDKGVLEATMRKRTKTKVQTVQIRHLDVDQPVRRKGVGTELLAAGLDHAFGNGVNAERVIVLVGPFTPEGEKLFKKCGFKRTSEKAPTIGLLKHEGKWMSVDPSDWAEKRDIIFSKSK